MQCDWKKNASRYLMWCHYTEKNSTKYFFFCGEAQKPVAAANLLDEEQKQTCHDNGENLPWEPEMTTSTAHAHG